ncbi:MAG: hypothetical protein ABI588_05795 [Arenimonas sp.]
MPAASRHKRAGFLQAYERRGHALLPFGAFMRRVAFNLLLGGVLTLGSLLVGMWGYSAFEGMGAVDSFLNASMILSGMGPAAEMHSDGGKLFAGFYALYSGLAVLVVAGLLFAPLLHRLLHHFHAADDDLNPPDQSRKKK